ncbi:hypothetical protein U8P80_35335 (plasmid) [Rhizobium beringeri]|nr:hypothetical protein U8P80_35335 [Rhizobium beringeri]WSH18614.1 hypothetical protein U8P74_35335 [Rhizobium beringeri]
MSVESQVYIWTVGKHADPQAVDAQLSAQSAPHGVSVKSEGLANWNLCQGFARIAATESGEEQKNPLILFMRDMVKRKLGSGMVVPSTVRTIALSRNLRWRRRSRRLAIPYKIYAMRADGADEQLFAAISVRWAKKLNRGGRTRVAKPTKVTMS